MKVPSTSLPQHTSRASFVSAGKNHVGYRLNRPHISRNHGKRMMNVEKYSQEISKMRQTHINKNK